MTTKKVTANRKSIVGQSPGLREAGSQEEWNAGVHARSVRRRTVTGKREERKRKPIVKLARKFDARGKHCEQEKACEGRSNEEEVLRTREVRVTLCPLKGRVLTSRKKTKPGHEGKRRAHKHLVGC